MVAAHSLALIFPPSLALVLVVAMVNAEWLGGTMGGPANFVLSIGTDASVRLLGALWTPRSEIPMSVLTRDIPRKLVGR